MKGREGGGKARRLQSSNISKEGQFSVDVSRTIGWTMVEEEEPEKSEADAAAFLPDTGRSEENISTTMRNCCNCTVSLEHITNWDQSTRLSRVCKLASSISWLK